MLLLNRLRDRIPSRRYLLAALALRLVLAPFLSHPYDMRVFMAVGAAVGRGITPYGQYVLQNMFAATPHAHLYGTFSGIGYPPLYGLVLGGMYTMSSALAPNDLYAYVLALKLPIIFGELALAVLIYNILKVQINERTAKATFRLFIFCPFIIAVGTIWGMFDTVALIFTILSAYFLQKNWKLSAIFLAVSSTLKVYPIVLVPLYSLLVYKRTRNLKRPTSYLLLTVGVAALFTFLPMIAFNWPLENMYNALTYHITTTGSSYENVISFPYGAASPFNVFTLANDISGGSVQPPAALAYVWIPACFFVYGLLFGSQLTTEVKTPSLSFDFAVTVQWSLLIMLTLFTTRAWVAEQNLVFLFAFFVLSIFNARGHFPLLWDRIEWLWLLLLMFVIVHVPVVSFLWLPVPGTLDVSIAFADGPFGWTRLLLMTVLTFGWLVMCWRYVIKELKWS
jgi:hypothetical protein